MKDFVHVSIGRGGGLLRTAAVLTCAQVRRVPVPPVMFGVRFFRTGRGAVPFREGARKVWLRPSLLVASTSIRDREVGS